MEVIKFVHTDGGRSKYFVKRASGDCVCRALSFAMDADYKEVFDELTALKRRVREADNCTGRSKATAAAGMPTRSHLFKSWMQRKGWVYTECKNIWIGTRTRMQHHFDVYLRAIDFPSTGTFIVYTNHHYCVIKDGVLYDSWNSSRKGMEGVYGYWYKP